MSVLACVSGGRGWQGLPLLYSLLTGRGALSCEDSRALGDIRGDTGRPRTKRKLPRFFPPGRRSPAPSVSLGVISQQGSRLPLSPPIHQARLLLPVFVFLVVWPLIPASSSPSFRLDWPVSLNLSSFSLLRPRQVAVWRPLWMASARTQDMVFLLLGPFLFFWFFRTSLAPLGSEVRGTPGSETLAPTPSTPGNPPPLLRIGSEPNVLSHKLGWRPALRALVTATRWHGLVFIVTH